MIPRSPFGLGSLGLALLLGSSLTAQTTTFVFNPPKDDPSNYPGKTPAFDIGAMLNEDVAGENGPVRAVGGQFVRGDGQPLRFWAATVGGMSDADQRAHARFIARRGMNLIRWHTSVYDNSSLDINSVRMNAVDQLQRMVETYKQEGVYTKVSHFFILGLRIRPEWEIDGYDEAYFAANPGKWDEAPFALQFFDEKFKGAMKEWMRVLFTTPSPYHPENKALKDEPAVAIVEFQNEDNTFFWTFDPGRWPVVQQQKAGKKFGDWLVSKYGSIGAATSGYSPVAGDNFAQGIVALQSAFSMTGSGGAVPTRRIQDQIAFLTQLQRDFYVELREFCEIELGMNTTFTGSNWTTADNANLLDAEFYAYAGAGVLDFHNYFGPWLQKEGQRAVYSVGDFFYNIPGVKGYRRLPLAYKHLENTPSILSESTWTNPTDRKGEAALLIAAYSSMNDLDGWIWFATGGPGWDTDNSTWRYQTPSMIGQFPGASLLYRRGDVAQAPAIVREGRSLNAIARKEKAILSMTTGWDPTRDPEQQYPQSQGLLDPAHFLVGQAELAIGSSDQDYIAPEAEGLIDNVNGTVRSITGELLMNEKTGFLKVETPQTEAATGFLADVGTIEGASTRLRMRNPFGALWAVALDDQPLDQSEKILIQAFTEERLSGSSYAAYDYNHAGKVYNGKIITAVGTGPWEIEQIDAEVTLKGGRTVLKIEQLDGNGYVEKDLTATAGSTVTAGYRVRLPKDALYTLVTLAPPSDRKPVITTKALPNALSALAFNTQVRSLGGDGAVSFSAVSGLPAGLSLAADGTISGTTGAIGSHTVRVSVTDADGDIGTRDLRFVVLDSGMAMNPFAALQDKSWTFIPTWGWNYADNASSGWCLNLPLNVWIHTASTPWIYHPVFGYLYAYEGDLKTGRWFYNESLGALYGIEGVGGWLYSDAQGKWIPPVAD